MWELQMPWATLLASLLCTAFTGPVLAAAEPPKDPEVDVRLARDIAGEIVLIFDIEDGWHIYWHNPGDSGMATTATLHPTHQTPRFPGPERFVAPESGFVTYGYSGRTALFFAAPASSTPVDYRAEARWLACKERCVLQKATATLSAGEPVELSALRARLPERAQPSVSYRGNTAVIVLDGGPFQLFPPVELEEQLTGFRPTATGLELDLKNSNWSKLPVVLQRQDGSFVSFELSSRPATKD